MVSQAEEMYGVDPLRFRTDPEYRRSLEARALAEAKKTGPLRYGKPVDEFTRAKDMLNAARYNLAVKVRYAEQYEAARREIETSPPSFSPSTREQARKRSRPPHRTWQRVKHALQSLGF